MFNTLSRYLLNNTLVKECELKQLIAEYIEPIIESNKLIQLKGNGSRVTNINWEMFFGKCPVNKNRSNINELDEFNQQVFLWFGLNLDPIESERVVIQFDGDKLLEDNLDNSDTLLQNYTGILYGLVYYLCHLNKHVDIVIMLDTSKQNWDKQIVTRWNDGLKQLHELDATIHFIIYDFQLKKNKEIILKDSLTRPNNKPTDIWGYKGYINCSLMANINFAEYSLLYFGVGEVPIDELIYLKYYDLETFNKIKDHARFYNLTRSNKLPYQDNINLSTIDNSKLCEEILQN